MLFISSFLHNFIRIIHCYVILIYSFEVASTSNNVLGGMKIIDTGAGFLLEEDPEEDVSAPMKIVHEPGN